METDADQRVAREALAKIGSVDTAIASVGSKCAFIKPLQDKFVKLSEVEAALAKTKNVSVDNEKPIRGRLILLTKSVSGEEELTAPLEAAAGKLATTDKTFATTKFHTSSAKTLDIFLALGASSQVTLEQIRAVIKEAKFEIADIHIEAGPWAHLEPSKK